MADQTARTLHIGFVLAPGMLATGTALPYEMWLAACDQRRASRQRQPACQLHLLAAAGAGADARMALTPDSGIDASPWLDVVYLPALWRHPLAIAQRLPALLPWLQAQFRHGAQIAAVSTGVALLAASGLLEGRSATTHWYCFADLARAYPGVHFKRDYFITQSGSIYCAASINSLADVTVHLIERFFDRAAAQHVERNFSHEIRRTYAEYRFLDGGDASPLADEIVVEAQLLIADNLGHPMKIAELAGRLNVSARTLERRFRSATGLSPRAYWQQQRLRLAKDLLENTNLSIGDIAWRVGYQDPAYFTRLFQREMLLTPSVYRQTVRAKLFRSALT